MQKKSLFGLAVASTSLFSLMLTALCSAQTGLPISRTTAVVPVPVTGPGTSTPLGIPFTREPVFRDVVSGSTASSITGVTGGYGVLAADTHIAVIVTGPSRGLGLTITSVTGGNTVNVSGTVPALTPNSDEFEIVPLPTLSSVFGAPPFDLVTASTAASADKIVIGATQYFYKQGGLGGNGWRLTTAPTGADQANTVVPTLLGVSVIRVGAAGEVGVRGVVRVNRSVLPIPSGTTLLSWPFPREVTLLASLLQNTILGASAAAGADKVVIGANQYFFKNGGLGGTGWRLTTAPTGADQGGVILNDDGKGFFIIRAGATTAHPVLEPLTP